MGEYYINKKFCKDNPKDKCCKMEEYNGWSNRETWALALHLGNTEWLDNATRESIKGKKGYEAGDALKDFVDNLKYEEETKDTKDVKLMIEDVGSLWRVDFQEAAESFQEE